MESEWKQTTVGDLINSGHASLQTGPFGTALKASEYAAEGVPLISVREIRYGYLKLTDNTPFVNKKTLDRLPSFILHQGDIVFGRKGSVDRSAMINKNQDGWFLGSDGIRLRLDDCYNHRFISYQVRSPAIQNWLIQHAEGTTMLSMNQKVLGRIPLTLPPLPEQKSIAHILGSLDDKIGLNRRMNATLEGMAQALFKSWFVDFDPVLDNAIAAGNPIPEELAERAELRRQALANGTANREAAKKFPAAFQPTEELGWIPVGWEALQLETLIELIGGGTPKTSIDEYWNGNIPWFSVVDAPNDSDVFVIDTDKKITELGVKNSSTKVLRKGSTIISARGTVGKCALVGTEMAMNQSCYGIHGANGISDIYIYYTIREFVADLQQHGHGSVFNTITRGTFKSIYVPFGRSELTQDFDKTVNPFLERICSNLFQNVELTKLRDTLLPKLISGELRIPEVEKLAEEAFV
jgi:type I restriction enzyme S subunit